MIVSKENIVFALAVKILVMILGLFGIASMFRRSARTASDGP